MLSLTFRRSSKASFSMCMRVRSRSVAPMRVGSGIEFSGAADASLAVSPDWFCWPFSAIISPASLSHDDIS